MQILTSFYTRNDLAGFGTDYSKAYMWLFLRYLHEKEAMPPQKRTNVEKRDFKRLQEFMNAAGLNVGECVSIAEEEAQRLFEEQNKRYLYKRKNR